MFYKKINNDWYCGYEVILPTNPETTLDENNRENDHGWIWHDTPPQDYLDWLEIQNSMSDFDDYEEIID